MNPVPRPPRSRASPWQGWPQSQRQRPRTQSSLYSSRQYCTRLRRSCQQQSVWEAGNGVRREGRACRDRRRVDVLIRRSARTSRASRTARTSSASLLLANHSSVRGVGRQRSVPLARGPLRALRFARALARFAACAASLRKASFSSAHLTSGGERKHPPGRSANLKQ